MNKFKIIMRNCELVKADVYHMIKNYRSFATLQVVNLSNNKIMDLGG